MEAPQYNGVVVVDLEQLGRDEVVAGRLPVHQAFRCSLHVLESWCCSQASGGVRRWSLRHVFDDVWVQGGGLGVEEEEK